MMRFFGYAMVLSSLTVLLAGCGKCCQTTHPENRRDEVVETMGDDMMDGIDTVDTHVHGSCTSGSCPLDRK